MCSAIFLAIFSNLFFNELCSKIGIKPKCRDSSIKSEFFGIIPRIGTFDFSSACLHNSSCFLLPTLLIINPIMLEFR